MKTLKLSFSFLILAFLPAFLLTGCKKDDDNGNANPKEIPAPECEGVTIDDAIILRFDYTNYAGQQPTVVIDKGSSDDRVIFDTTHYTPVQIDNKIVVSIPNIRLSDDEFNYIAECVTIEEFDDTRPSNDRWFVQTEFKNQREFSETKLATMLCLDVSSSLGEDRELVKQYAIDFAEQVYETTSNESYVGLVLFADTVITYPFTNDLDDIIAAINSFPYPDLDAQTFTRLSDGILAGLTALEETNLDVADKVLVAFTDGNDNGSNNPTVNQQTIKESSFRRYMIGLKGKGLEYNTNYLKGLASDDIFFVEAENAIDLQDRFNDINELIANIYTIIYNRSTQTFTEGIDEPIKLRAIFYARPYKIE
ncbi:MAG TPA: VWA domain-containing protein [Saprospiraceae bacterium]|mgnify:CR=1 FL=1|nr:VWA domain-containing protein [Saprospiraceae bacterium]HMQ81920.1 VWA domain-containing protein [Saprospiraceae bacterium]